MYRQGDVLLIPYKENLEEKNVEKISKEGEDIILAEGEISGHTHRVAKNFMAQLILVNNLNRILSVKKETTLSHEEHDPIILPVGNYSVVIQRELVPEGLDVNKVEKIKPVSD